MSAKFPNPRLAAVIGLAAIPALAWRLTRAEPGWVAMWAIAVAEFLALKLLTLTAVRGERVPLGRIVSYVVLWPGMDARAFLAARTDRRIAAPPRELAFGLLKMAGGIAACYWAAENIARANPLAVAWVGMVGIIFMLHFGLLHVVSWLWRRGGVNAPPIMHAPIASDSLAAFWGGRWNAAFADVARRFLFRPTVHRLGSRGAGALVFLVSGLVHESVLSLPARGGWGGPTAYFLLQAAGMAVEKSAVGKKLGLGEGLAGWAWTLFCTAAPLPLLLHAPFVFRVILPLFETLNRLLP